MIGRGAVDLEVAPRELEGVTGVVDRGRMCAAALELLRDARRAGEQVECARRADRAADVAEHGYEAAFRPEVLDHDRRGYEAFTPESRMSSDVRSGTTTSSKTRPC